MALRFARVVRYREDKRPERRTRFRPCRRSHLRPVVRLREAHAAARVALEEQLSDRARRRPLT